VPDAQRVLARLSGAHLIQLSRPGTFRMHALLRSYARELAFLVDGADLGDVGHASRPG
jgi:hypothetical protein